MSAHTLLVRLAGPQQAWGSGSRFAKRGTETAPTRSGVIGLVAAALGLERTAPLDMFHGVRFGVRVDQPGTIERDFQTARTLDGTTSMPLSDRFYLADAVFLAGLESDDVDLLERFRTALAAPRYPLYLGRRAFPPAGPLRTWVVEGLLMDALSDTPWQGRVGRASSTLELYIDAKPGDRIDLTLADDPQSFDPRRRRYGWRDVTVSQIAVEDQSAVATPSAASPPTKALADHDPFRLTNPEEV